jgi:hypothetical protein
MQDELAKMALPARVQCILPILVLLATDQQNVIG